MIEHARLNPFRTVDWRWQRAVGALEGTQRPPSRRRDEPVGLKWIRRAMIFKKEYDAADDPLDRLELSERRSSIYWAHTLRHKEQAMRFAVEAYLLARQSDFEIGFRCGLSPDIVEAYEALFFNVREKLNHSEYILHCVIGPSLQQSLSERFYEILWKLYGYFCGPHFLSGLISKFPNPVWCQTPDAMSAAIQDDAISTLKLKAAVAAKTVPVTQSTQIHLMEQFTRFVEVERTTESQGRAQDQILGHISALFSALPFQTGAPDARSGMDTNPVDLYDQSAVELTFEETLRASVRQSIPHGALLRQLSYPQTALTQKDLEAEKLAENS